MRSEPLLVGMRFEPVWGGMRDSTLMVRSATSRVSNHEAWVARLCTRLKKSLAQARDGRRSLRCCLVDLVRRFRQRLDHLDASAMADVGQLGWQRYIGDQGL